jgi:DNA processing protein
VTIRYDLVTQDRLTTINMDAREVHRGQRGYPMRLDALSDAPPILWIVGAWSPAERAVAIVGARAARNSSTELAHSMAAKVAAQGVDVISGGALGVDAAAHRGAISAEGRTVAVLGNGIDVVYPEKHADLFLEIQKDGALVTQFPPGQTPRPGQFPTRNKVIAGLAEMVVVVEASVQSGSLHTARAARALGRPVLAVPGSSGTDSLLTSGGAVPVMDGEDVLAILDGRQPAPPALPEDPDVRKLYDALDSVPRDVSDLAFRAGLGISTCASMVIDLELSGLAARAAGGRYVRLR